MTTQNNAAPQSCYPEEIETLREMLDQEEHLLRGFCNYRASDFTPPHPSISRVDILAGIERSKRRVDALRTAIEALAGAL